MDREREGASLDDWKSRFEIRYISGARVSGVVDTWIGRVGGTVTRTRFQSHKGVPTSIIPVRYLAEIFKYIRNTLAALAELFECFQEIAGCISLHYAASITLWILLCRILMRRVDPARARAPPERGPLLLFLAFQTRHLRITTLIGATRDLSDPWFRVDSRRRVSRRFQLVLKELKGGGGRWRGGILDG